jgi:uncharacterized protein YkwD
MTIAPKRGSNMVHKGKILTCLFLITSIFSTYSSAKAMTEYRVHEGDTMWEISLRNAISLDKLLLDNPQLGNPNLIYPGDIIYLPIERGNSVLEKETLLQIINAERKKAGLRPFLLDKELTEIAQKKSMDMKEKQYVAHKSPTYGNPTEMIRSFQIPVRSVRENIGAGEESASAIFNTWMNSQPNRENLLQKTATHIGIGYAEGGLHGHYWALLIIEKTKE